MNKKIACIIAILLMVIFHQYCFFGEICFGKLLFQESRAPIPLYKSSKKRIINKKSQISAEKSTVIFNYNKKNIKIDNNSNNYFQELNIGNKKEGRNNWTTEWKQNNKANYIIATKKQPEDYPSSINKSRIMKNGLIKFIAISCEPLSPAVLLYNRIFKTGSTSIVKLIKTTTNSSEIFVKEGTTEDWYKTGDSFPYPENILKHSLLHKRLIYIGHFFFRHKLHIYRSHTYINILREPLARVISHYNYMRNEKLRPKHRILELKKQGYWNESIIDCVLNQHRGCEDNVMTRFFCGAHQFCRNGSAKALTRAKDNMLNYYAVIGTLDNINTFMKILHIRFPSILPILLPLSYEKQNSKTLFLGNNSTVAELILSRNKADVELYKYAVKIQEIQIKSCGL